MTFRNYLFVKIEIEKKREHTLISHALGSQQCCRCHLAQTQIWTTSSLPISHVLRSEYRCRSSRTHSDLTTACVTSPMSICDSTHSDLTPTTSNRVVTHSDLTVRWCKEWTSTEESEYSQPLRLVEDVLRVTNWRRPVSYTHLTLPTN